MSAAGALDAYGDGLFTGAPTASLARCEVPNTDRTRDYLLLQYLEHCERVALTLQ